MRDKDDAFEDDLIRGKMARMRSARDYRRKVKEERKDLRKSIRDSLHAIYLGDTQSLYNAMRAIENHLYSLDTEALNNDSWSPEEGHGG